MTNKEYNLTLQEARVALAHGEVIESPSGVRWRWPLRSSLVIRVMDSWVTTKNGPTNGNIHYRIVPESELNPPKKLTTAGALQCEVVRVEVPENTPVVRLLSYLNVLFMTGAWMMFPSL